MQYLLYILFIFVVDATTSNITKDIKNVPTNITKQNHQINPNPKPVTQDTTLRHKPYIPPNNVLSLDDVDEIRQYNYLIPITVGIMSAFVIGVICLSLKYLKEPKRNIVNDVNSLLPTYKIYNKTNEKCYRRISGSNSPI